MKIFDYNKWEEFRLSKDTDIPLAISNFYKSLDGEEVIFHKNGYRIKSNPNIIIPSIYIEEV